jgi:DNA polymerase sigma
VRRLPPLRPLLLVLKALLREAGLNEVFSGGLSSYSLFSMVLAHLQCEGYEQQVGHSMCATNDQPQHFMVAESPWVCLHSTPFLPFFLL